MGDSTQVFLDLLKIALTRVDPTTGMSRVRSIRAARGRAVETTASASVGRIRGRLDWLSPRLKMALWLMIRFVPERSRWRQELRAVGRDLPRDAETMVGLVRLDNVEHLALDVIARGVPGDFAEAGVWRGGVGILMRAVQTAAGADRRRVWLCDSFEGLPSPDPSIPADRGSPFHRVRALAVSESEVRQRFERYGLLSANIRFVKGWFAEALPPPGLDALALLRIDADMYGSTMDALAGLYRLVSPGGFVIVDDYGAIPECRAAVDDFRREQGITSPVEAVDFTGVYWRVEP